jgi:hypothetical protein
MSRFTKAILALSLLVALTPAVQCATLTQQRTQLENYINNANAASFKKAFFNIASESKQDEFNYVCTHLKQYVNIKKTELQKELTALGEETIEKENLTKGVLQGLVSIFALYSGTRTLYKKYKKEDYYLIDTVLGHPLQFITASVRIGAGTYALAKYAIPNCITGYDYAKHLRLQIANLDEIITTINTIQK